MPPITNSGLMNCLNFQEPVSNKLVKYTALKTNARCVVLESFKKVPYSKFVIKYTSSGNLSFLKNDITDNKMPKKWCIFLSIETS